MMANQQMYAQYYQGPYAAEAVLGYGPLAVGMVFTAGGGNPGVFTAGTPYTVTAVAIDPHGNSAVAGSYPGDTVTLTTLGMLPASALANAYRIS